MKMAMTGAQPLTYEPLPGGSWPPSLFLPGARTQFPIQNLKPCSFHLIFNKYFHSTGF